MHGNLKVVKIKHDQIFNIAVIQKMSTENLTFEGE